MMLCNPNSGGNILQVVKKKLNFQCSPTFFTKIFAWMWIISCSTWVKLILVMKKGPVTLVFSAMHVTSCYKTPTIMLPPMRNKVPLPQAEKVVCSCCSGNLKNFSHNLQDRVYKFHFCGEDLKRIKTYYSNDEVKAMSNVNYSSRSVIWRYP